MSRYTLPLVLFIFGLISLAAYRLIPSCNVDIQTLTFCASVDKAGLLLFFTLIVSFVLAGVTAALAYAASKKSE